MCMRLRAVKRTDWWDVGSGAVGGGEGEGECVAGGIVLYCFGEVYGGLR